LAAGAPWHASSTKGEEKMDCPLNCGMGAEITIAYVARRLNAETRAKFQQHIATCAQCVDALAAQGAVWTALDDLRAPRVSETFDEKLFHRIAHEEQRARRAS
jgi:anti-sigma factor RsiW